MDSERNGSAPAQSTDSHEPHRRALGAINVLLETKFPTSPSDQLGVLAVATVCAVQRQFVKEGITDRGRRHRIVKAFLRDFEKKLRHMTSPDFGVRKN